MKSSGSKRLSAACAFALGLSFAIAPLATSSPTRGTTHTVVIDGVRFEPETLSVRPGDTVVWVNHDPFPHTATSQAGRFDSHEIGAGASWQYTPDKSGVFPYVCTFHPTMRATLIVR